jgi:hypothetical protein
LADVPTVSPRMITEYIKIIIHNSCRSSIEFCEGDEFGRVFLAAGDFGWPARASDRPRHQAGGDVSSVSTMGKSRIGARGTGSGWTIASRKNG